MERRQFLKGGASIGLLPAVQGLAASRSAMEPPPIRSGIDRDRASYLLRRFGLDALCLGEPVNVRYVIGQLPFSGRMGLAQSSFAVVPRDAAEPIKYISSQPRFYLTQTDTELYPGVEPILVAGAADGGEPRPFFFPDPQEGELTTKERHRRLRTMAASPFMPNQNAALATALSEASGSYDRIGYDSLDSQAAIQSALPAVTAVNGMQAALHMRMVKTPDEIELMRMASAVNIEAAHLAASTLRSAPRILDLRKAYGSHAEALGNTPVFLVIDGSVAETYDAELIEGSVLLIDCVSEYQGFHGDYGRTIFYGEPRRNIRSKVEAIALAWTQLSQELRPGLRFSQIAARGQEILRTIDPNILVPFRPHSVGLAHTEHPAFDHTGAQLDPLLEPGMIISVDCPLLEAIPEGTVHLEDLMLITTDGAEPIHEIGDPFIIV